MGQPLLYVSQLETRDIKRPLRGGAKNERMLVIRQPGWDGGEEREGERGRGRRGRENRI